VSDPVIVIGIRFLDYSLNFMYVISDSNILFFIDHLFLTLANYGHQKLR